MTTEYFKTIKKLPDDELWTIPKFPRYQINKRGEVFDSITNRYLTT